MVAAEGIDIKYLENSGGDAAGDEAGDGDSYHQLNQGKAPLVLMYQPKSVKHHRSTL